MPTFAIGDIHGNVDGLRDLLARMAPEVRRGDVVVFLGDEEMAVITRSGVKLTDYSGRDVSVSTMRVLWDPIAVRAPA